MENAVAERKRKLIDIPGPVFDVLSMESQRRQVPLKRLIESVLSETAVQLETAYLQESPGSSLLGKLIGSAKPKAGRLEDIQDDRLQYLLSK